MLLGNVSFYESKEQELGVQGSEGSRMITVVCDLCGTNFRIGCSSSVVRDEEPCVTKGFVISYTPVQ